MRGETIGAAISLIKNKTGQNVALVIVPIMFKSLKDIEITLFRSKKKKKLGLRDT